MAQAVQQIPISKCPPYHIWDKNRSVMAGVSSLFNGQRDTQLDGEWKLKVLGSVFVTLAIELTFVGGWVGTAIVSKAAG